ncbi:TetR/AcrR family transcriptional regulator [Kutzneria sp. CA-103260]|uniref:TetR/AcrR family transcriptional regulator n=1 Tax=Kutzneria sp. CA-103260 TaxID=2802641 RepID=UPI001BAC6C91|nr:TetR/AcrR family transcriptional regulator [Kutzneria sp. CA-103260]QUQ72312.1 TetR family transcriptional regulator [Kutzneria sp. CA-103260]
MGRTRGFDTDRALDAALRTFWEHGYEASSIQDLCRAMDVQPGSVYAAFGTKRELFGAALRRYVQTVSSEAIGRITAAPTGLLGLRDYFSHLVDAMVDGDRRWGCLITNSLVEFAGRDAELAGLMQLHLANLRAAFAAALSRAEAAAEIRPGSSPDLLVAVVQGMNVLAKNQPGRPVLQSIADAALAGLTP